MTVHEGQAFTSNAPKSHTRLGFRARHKKRGKEKKSKDNLISGDVELLNIEIGVFPAVENLEKTSFWCKKRGAPLRGGGHRNLKKKQAFLPRLLF